MNIYSIFAQPNKDEGVVTAPLKAALIASNKYPYCLSSKTVNSSVIIDSGASVCISPNRFSSHTRTVKQKSKIYHPQTKLLVKASSVGSFKM